MMTCEKCGFQIGESAKFCQECGSPLNQACDNCGTDLPISAKFCPQCGASQISSGKPIRQTDDNNPQHADAYFNRGFAYITQGQFEQAIQDYDEGIRLNPQNAMVYVHRGFAYSGQGQHELAIQDFGEAIRIDPQSALGYHMRGTQYSLLDKTIEAERDIAKAKELGGYDPSVTPTP